MDLFEFFELYFEFDFIDSLSKNFCSATQFSILYQRILIIRVSWSSPHGK